MMVRRDGAGVRLLTRNGHDWTPRHPLIAEAANAPRIRSFLIDGGAVACDGDGLTGCSCLRSNDGLGWPVRPNSTRPNHIDRLYARQPQFEAMIIDILGAHDSVGDAYLLTGSSLQPDKGCDDADQSGAHKYRLHQYLWPPVFDRKSSYTTPSPTTSRSRGAPTA